MTVLIDTSILIDHLRGRTEARSLLVAARTAGPIHASEMTRLEVLVGMRPKEEAGTRLLLSVLTWHPVDKDIAEQAGELGRTWLPSHSNIDGADLAIAATAINIGAQVLTRNVRHFPMFPGLRSPYV